MNYKTLGIIGGGQLGMMIAKEAKNLELKVIILDPNKECSASQYADVCLDYPFNSVEGMQKMNKLADIVTYEFENINEEILSKYIDNEKLVQGINALQICKNRAKEKEFLVSNNIPIADFKIINSYEGFLIEASDFNYNCVLKSCLEGYDGKGQIVITSKKYDEEKVKNIISKGYCVLEKLVSIKHEASIMVARNKKGDVVVLPVSENINENGILIKSIVPARLNNKLIKDMEVVAKKIATSIDLIGVMGVEFFIDNNDELLVNELAPRVHNSGHYSLDGCSVNQFYLHILALFNETLDQNDIYAIGHCVMVNCLGQHYEAAKLECLNHLNWHPYFYSKGMCKQNRKMGHINIVGNDVNSIIDEIEKTKIW